MVKIDPYLNEDAGSLSPEDHGEVFVLEDGTEVDLDFGHYERSLGSLMLKRVGGNNLRTKNLGIFGLCSFDFNSFLWDDLEGVIKKSN